MYKNVPPRLDLVSMEHEILSLWDAGKIFEKSLDQTKDKPRWVFYEGPPTANGTPGTHHVEARVFKDVFPRYKTMKGFHVPRKAGWDCHGLPVEIAVEKELGFQGKGDIENFGVAEFNEKCRESVVRHVNEFTEMTKRMAYWVDFDEAYWTMNPDYIESVWWSLKVIFDKGLLVQDHRVSPYCPRCGTGLSDHELAQGYEDITDDSVYVNFKVIGELASTYSDLSLVIWTTTPWTLLSNTAAAVHPDIDYVIVTEDNEQHFIVAKDLVSKLFGDEATIKAVLRGRDLEGVRYQRPFEYVEFPETDAPLHSVLLADFVTVEEGTGIVHEAPAFGAEDLLLCKQYGLPVVNPILSDGTFSPEIALVGGMFFKDADKTIVKELKSTGLLFKHEPFLHPYPHCWRCHTPLIYYAQPSWYIKTTAIKDALLRENEATNWYPSTIKWGRFGDWLHNNVDWALSRNRYWGTPLPIWRCESDHLTCIGSLSELGQKSGVDVANIDPHRPYVDDISIVCDQCGDSATRVPEVIDCWYDSGAMPFAQWGYPHNKQANIEDEYPADFICEAIDQTRGWFYTLMAIGTLVFDKSSYENVVCLGHILDEQGRKMSKHLGNVLEPVGLMDEHGADALRWYMLASGSPWQARRVGHTNIAEVVRKVLLTYWSTVSFQALYARESDFTYQKDTASKFRERPLIDQWLLNESNLLAKNVDRALEVFDTQRAGKVISEFIDLLSNWYVRRNRRRFWDGEKSALETLHEALETLTLVLAPFTPFIAERVWQDLFVGTNPDVPSVHLASWPDVDEERLDTNLSEHMQIIIELVELGRAARAESKVKTRQPLARALIGSSKWSSIPSELKQHVSDELNVKVVESLAEAEGELTSISLKANFRNLGKRYGSNTQQVANLLHSQDANAVRDELQTNSVFKLHDAALGEIEFTEEDVIITELPKSGWAVSSSDGLSVALDLTLNDDLMHEGIAREVVRLLQESRKSSGFEVSNRIVVHWQCNNEDTRTAIKKHQEWIESEVLALTFEESDASLSYSVKSDDLGFAGWIEVKN
ncbi:MAG: isoleucine--tRNA ligase [Candidatus Nanopelagicales bacterium]